METANTKDQRQGCLWWAWEPWRRAEGPEIQQKVIWGHCEEAIEKILDLAVRELESTEGLWVSGWSHVIFKIITLEALKISYWSGQGQRKGLQFASYWNNPGEKQWWLGSADSSERLNQLRHIKSGSPGDSDSKESACNVGDLGLVLGSGRSPAEGNGNPLQYPYLENAWNKGAWWATVHGVTVLDTTEQQTLTRHIKRLAQCLGQRNPWRPAAADHHCYSPVSPLVDYYGYSPISPLDKNWRFKSHTRIIGSLGARMSLQFSLSHVAFRSDRLIRNLAW